MKKDFNDDFRHKGLTEEEINSPEFDPDEFAPKHKNDFHIPTENKQPLIFVFFTVLLSIILIVVGMATSVDSFREDVKADYVLSQYEAMTSCEYYKTLSDCDVYVVYLNGNVAGYGVYCTEPSFAGNIKVLVCFGIDNKISKVRVVSSEESVGVGSEITDNEYLSVYKSLSKLDDVSAVEGILITGATDSSDAVKNAVKTVLSLDLDAYRIANELGTRVATEDEIKKAQDPDYKEDKEDIGTSADTDDSDETTRKHNNYVPDTGEFDSRELDGRDTDYNVNTGDGNIGADGSDVTTDYITESDTTDTTVQSDSDNDEITDTDPVVSDTTDESTGDITDTSDASSEDSTSVDSVSEPEDSDSSEPDSKTP